MYNFAGSATEQTLVSLGGNRLLDVRWNGHLCVIIWFRLFHTQLELGISDTLVRIAHTRIAAL